MGGLRKSEVRRIARERGLPVADKRDSTGICFIGERPFGDFVGRWLPGRAGPIENDQGVVVGRHRGLERYTHRAAQRPRHRRARGCGRCALVRVPPRTSRATRSSWCRAPITRRCIAAGSRAVDPHWIAGRAPAAPFACTAKVRYRQPDVACRVALSGDALDVRFDAPLSGAAPGQYVVFYEGEECLGGAAIMAAYPLEDSCRTASRPAASSRPADAATNTSRSTRIGEPNVGRLPYSLKVLLENLLRHEDGRTVTRDDILALAKADPRKLPQREIAFTPGARDHAGLHRRAGRRRPRRHARCDGEARRRPGAASTR